MGARGEFLHPAVAVIEETGTPGRAETEPDSPQFHVAIVIPVAGDAPYLSQSLASVDGALRVEAIVVEDGPSRPRMMPAGFPVRHLATGKRSGPAGARNTGIRSARAPLIAFLDADDLFTPGHLERCLRRLQESGADAVAGVGRWAAEDGSPLGAPDWDWHDFNAATAFGSILMRNPIATPTVVVRRELLMRLGGFDGTLTHAEDYDLWLRIARNGRWAYLNSVEALVRRHGSNTSRDQQAHLDAERQILRRWQVDAVDAAFADLFPGSRAQRLTALATYAFKTGNELLMREGLRELRHVDPLSPLAPFLIGTWDLQSGRLQAALEALEGGSALPSAPAELWNNLGVALCQSERLEEAQRAFERARHLRQDYRDPALNLESLRACHLDQLRVTLRPLRKHLPPP